MEGLPNLEKLTSQPVEKVRNILEEFTAKNADVFNFEKFHTDDKWLQSWQTLFGILSKSGFESLRLSCLNAIRILSRDSQSIKRYDMKATIDTLLEIAQLASYDVEKIDVHFDRTTEACVYEMPDKENIDIIVAALKCLCNLIYQGETCRKYCVKTHTTDAIVKRIRSAAVRDTMIEFYDLKLLFLLTALEPSARSRVQLDLNGLTYMTEWLDEIVHDTNFSNEKIDSLIEMLKVIFNITSTPDKSPNECEIQYLHLVGVIRQFLFKFTNLENEQHRNVVAHIINLLTNMTYSCLSELIVKCDAENSEFGTKNMVRLEERNVFAIDTIIRYLKIILDEQANTASSVDNISPVLTVLIKCARSHRVIRHYIRSIILPPLRDVSQRPEVGNELRNHLCRFLTLPGNLIQDLSAELLFILCKENVGRMIKYTGYGNAAGLFAKRGLMDCRKVENSEYSSDSEDSDTEEYKQAQPTINPVLGCTEGPKKNPLEGMSEEQKEYEALQLVNLMDKLHRSGVVQPCRIGEDGKPQPVDHILQLQEELPQQQFEQKRKT